MTPEMKLLEPLVSVWQPQMRKMTQWEAMAGMAGDLKSQPGESARRAAEEKVGREVSTTPSESGERKQEGSEQEKASKREETAAEAGI